MKLINSTGTMALLLMLATSCNDKETHYLQKSRHAFFIEESDMLNEELIKFIRK